jgi:high-affinity iron transporter
MVTEATDIEDGGSMGATLLITFRESLEAALVVGLVLAVLGKTDQKRLNTSVWIGLVAGILVSLLVAWGFVRMLGQFEGREEQLFEGSVMLVGSLLLATLILWTGSHSSGSKLEGQASKAAAGGRWGILVLVFVSILREGVETVVYLGTSLRDGGLGTFIGGLAGIGIALVMGILIFASGTRFPLKRFFGVTTALLLLFGAGLFGRAAGEFVEAGILPPLVDPLWVLAPPVDGAALPLFNDGGAIGSFLKGLFGYSSSPSLMQVIFYLLFLGGLGSLLLFRNMRVQTQRRPQVVERG